MANRDVLRLRPRRRFEWFRGSGGWEESEGAHEIPAAETAVLLCDVWDRHWCPSAAARVDEMAAALDEVVSIARAKGCQIVHAPSDTLDFYADSPHRKSVLALPRVLPPPDLDLPDIASPVDASDGGCDAPTDTQNLAPDTAVWTRQHPAIAITGDDIISDSGTEIYGLMQARGLRYLILLGVHTNMCVLGRSFGIRQMTRWGVRCLLMRDLTDSMYNPAMPPYVDHFTGNRLIIAGIEQHWCPTITSSDFTDRVPFRFQEDRGGSVL